MASPSFNTAALLESLPDAVQAFDHDWRYVYLNARAAQMFGKDPVELLGKVYWNEFPDTIGSAFEKEYRRAVQHRIPVAFEIYHASIARWLDVRAYPTDSGLSVYLRDVTARHMDAERTLHLLADLQEERETLDTVNRLGRVISAELDLQKLVQAATDAATELTGAQFGAFFYNITNDQGESYLLYTVSGVPRETFSRFPMPRNTPIFGPTFRGEGTIRLDDVTKDSRYGTMSPYHGMPPGHLPVRSYLAVPVVSRFGEVLGGLFFGHARPGIFDERAERNLEALVAQLAVAMDNARLYGQAQREIEERRRAEEALLASADALRESQLQTRIFLRDILASVTEGKLLLCDSPADLPKRLTPVGEPIALTQQSVVTLRRRVTEAAEIVGLEQDRTNDLITAVGEAGMNAVVHAGGGTAVVGVDPANHAVQVWIEDRGGGIAVNDLPRATLERGFTTAGTFGHGFWLILKTVDRVWLLTGTTGTTVVIEQLQEIPSPSWLGKE